MLRSVGAVASPFDLPLLLHLALAAPSGRLGTRSARFVVAAVYALAAAVSAGLALFRDPFLDPYCWQTCADNAFLVHADPGLADTLGDVWTSAALAIGAALAVVATRRPAVATATARRVLMPTVVPLAVAGVAEVAYAIALLHDPLEDPDETGFAAIFFVRSLAAFVLALGIAWSVVRVYRVRSSVSRFATDVAEAPRAGTLRDGLAAALGDPGLEVHYWLAASGRFVDPKWLPGVAPVGGERAAP